MKKVFYIFTLVIVFLSLSSNASTLGNKENSILRKKIETLETALKEQKRENDINRTNLSNLKRGRISLAKKCDSLDVDITKLRIETNRKIDKERSIRLANVDYTKSTINVIFITVLITILTLLAIIVTFIIIRKRFIGIHHSIIDEQESQTSDIKMLKDHIVDFDNSFLDKLAYLLSSKSQPKGTPQDHTLALHVANEISRMETNMSKMDSTVRGYKQLQKSIERIRNYYISQGYDIVEMLGKSYDEGMLVNADFVVDESLPKGSQIITSVKRPQVNYKGEMIQKATIIVSMN